MKIFQLILNEDNENAKGVFAMSIVNNPAFKSFYVALAEEKVLFKVDEKKKNTITGVALMPDKLVTRLNKKTNEQYQVYFSKDTIEKTSQEFLKNFNQSNVTVEHMLSVDDVTVVESWISVDDELDKSNALGIEAPAGSWFMTLKVENSDLWDGLIETGLLNGLSIEGNFEKHEMTALEFSEINKNQNDMNKKENNIIKAIREAFMGKDTEKVEAEAEIAQVSKWWSTVVNDTFAIDDKVEYKPLEDGGEPSPVSAGEYELEDKRRILIDSEGIIRFIFDDKAVEEPVVEEETEEVAEEVEEEVEASAVPEPVETPVPADTKVKVETKVATPEVAPEKPTETVAEVKDAIETKVEEDVAPVMVPHTDTQSRKRIKFKFDRKLTVQERIQQNLEANLS